MNDYIISAKQLRIKKTRNYSGFRNGMLVFKQGTSFREVVRRRGRGVTNLTPRVWLGSIPPLSRVRLVI